MQPNVRTIIENLLAFSVKSAVTQGEQPSGECWKAINAAHTLLSSPPSVPSIVVELSGGMINCVRSDTSARVALLDADTEGGDEDNISEINGVRVYVSLFDLANQAAPGNSGIDADFVSDIFLKLIPPIIEHSARYFAVTGRIPGDDEDTLHVFHVSNRDEALKAFEEALWENEPDAETGRDTVFKNFGQIVFVNSIVVSDSPISAL